MFRQLLGQWTVRIPLDYYRILGLPIQAPAEQLKQAHDDRTHQMPRREYSESAVAARKSLLDQAYEILANPDDRANYDQKFLATTSYDTELGEPSRSDAEPTPHIDIADQHLVGALLILQELGEYELVLKVGRPYLSSGRFGSGSSSLQNGQFGDPNIALADTVLTIALACLDLGREHWQQGQHETAAEALETGEELLLREGLFAGIRGEIQSDLLRLRPYRVLELLALPDQQYPSDRKKGLSLLQDMLRERDGIDGAGDDQSGLSMDDFLRFVQQLRGYLSAEEQQVLFEEEARRPSAVATYLAIYALIARGFAEHQPALIRRAKHLLAKLSARQDVHLEQSVCALFLGQTEEANRLLELSQEYEPIAFIREHSQGSPDWLPGLCLYAERWLGSEVYPHFRDLAQSHVALKEYFADEQVQLYLEELPAEGVETQASSSRLSNVSSRSDLEDPWAEQPAELTYGHSPASNSPTSNSPTSNSPTSNSLPPIYRRESGRESIGTIATVENKANFDEEAERAGRSRTAQPEKISKKTKTKNNNPTQADRAHRDILLAAGAIGPVGAGTSGMGTSNAGVSNVVSGAVPLATSEIETVGSAAPIAPRRIQKRPVARRTVKRGGLPPWLPWALGIVGVMAMGFGITRLIRSRPTEPIASITPSPIVSAPNLPNRAIAVQGDLTDTTAKQVLELWFAVKKAAMGPGYAIDQLDQVLIEPNLSVWKNEAKAAQRDGSYVEYEHAVEIKKVEINATNPNEAFVTANVRELRKYYEGGNFKDQQTDDLVLRYVLSKQNNQWKISSWRQI